jgi:hypothetical protein
MTQHCPDTFSAVEGANGGQHVCGITALPSTRPEQTLLTELGQQGVEEQVFGITLDQTRAKLAEH